MRDRRRINNCSQSPTKIDDTTFRESSMNLETQISLLQRQNRLLKSILGLIAILAAIALCMGAASFNEDRGELLQITKIQLVDATGNEVAIIDSKGIN